MCVLNSVCSVGGHRCIPPDQPQHDGSGSGAETDHVQSGPPQQTFHTGQYVWPPQ